MASLKGGPLEGPSGPSLSHSLAFTEKTTVLIVFYRPFGRIKPTAKPSMAKSTPSLTMIGSKSGFSAIN